MAIFKLLKSSTSAKHTHILYVKDDGTGLSTEKQGHSHQLVMEPQFEQVQAGVDSMGMPIMQQQQVGQTPTISEANGHTHEVGDVPIVAEKEKETDEDIVANCKELWQQAVEFNEKSRKAAEKSERLFKNEQWKRADKNALEADNRPALTYNIAYPSVKTLSGVQRQHRTDLKFYPIESGDQRVADMLDQVSKHIFTQTGYWQEETELFEKVCQVGLGAFEMYTDFTENIEGDIKIQDFSWRNFLLGEHMKKDISDLEYLIKIKKIAKKKLSSLYPEKKKEIEETTRDTDAIKETTLTVDSGRTIPSDPTLKEVDAYCADDISKNYVVMKEFWIKEWETAKIFVDIDTEESINLQGWKKADADSLKTLGNVDIVNRATYKIRVIKMANNVILEDEYPEMPFNDFDLVPVYAEKVGEVWFGKIELIKDAQAEFNKRMSTMADKLNKLDFSGYFIDGETFDDDTTADDFKKTVSRPGFVQRVGHTEHIPVKVDGARYPAELEQACSMMLKICDRLLNVNPEILGQPSSVESGKALIQKERQALLGNEYLFDNLSMAKKKIGRNLVKMIQSVYTAERIERILNNQNQKTGKVQIGDKNFSEYSREEIIAMINEADLSQYDVAIEEVSFTPTMRLWISSMLSELAAKGVQVPPQIIIEMFPLPDNEKQKILDSLNQAQQQAMQEQQMKSQTELQKTMIAKGQG